jgi:hypothetical protein
VIDVTHPAFALALTREDLAAIYEKHVEEFRKQPALSPQMRETLSASVIGSALIASSGTFLAAIPTYYLKVGAQNVAPGGHPIDRAIAGSAPATLIRQRLQDMARLLADGLKPLLAAQPEAPILFPSIAGGVAADTWNAVLYLRQENPALLEGRSIAVRVLDTDPAAPAFGAQAVAALSAPGQPLAGLSTSWEFLPYDWSNAADLSAYLGDLGARDAVCATSAEGGLFEYGSDEEIVANLRAIYDGTGADSVVVGSVTRNCEQVRLSLAMGGATIRPRALDDFLALAASAGWQSEAVLERPTTFNVRLGKR